MKYLAFGKALRELRIQKKLSIEKLARLAELSSVTVRNWEKGLSSPQQPELLHRVLAAIHALPTERDKIYQLLHTVDDNRNFQRLSIPFNSGSKENNSGTMTTSQRRKNGSKEDSGNNTPTPHNSLPTENYDKCFLWSGLLSNTQVPKRDIRAALGIGEEELSRWCSGARSPSREHQKALLDLLGVSPETKQYFLAGIPPTFLQNVDSNDLDQLIACDEQLWEMELQGKLGPEGDGLFFALEERLWEHVQLGNPHAASFLAFVFTKHSDWRGRHRYQDRERLTHLGLLYAPTSLKPSHERGVWIGLELQSAGLALGPLAIKKLEKLIHHLANPSYREDLGLYTDALCSLAQRYAKKQRFTEARRLLAEARQRSKVHADFSSFSGYITLALHNSVQVLLAEGCAREALDFLPPVEGDERDRDIYGVASRLLLQARTYLQVGESSEAFSLTSRAEKLISGHGLTGLSSQLVRLQRRF